MRTFIHSNMKGLVLLTYDLLVDLLFNDMFDHVTAFSDLTLNMTSGENIHLMVNYLTDTDYEKNIRLCRWKYYCCFDFNR